MFSLDKPSLTVDCFPLYISFSFLFAPLCQLTPIVGFAQQAKHLPFLYYY